MTTSTPITLMIGPERWRLGWIANDQPTVVELPIASDADLSTRIAALCDHLAASEGPAGPIVLAVDSASCLSAIVTTSDLGRTGRRNALLYRLEEHLPVAAEQIVADYVQLEGDQAMGVAVEIEPLKEIIAALEANDFEVGPIVPLAMLIAGFAVHEKSDIGSVHIADAVNGTDLVTIHGEVPSQWVWHPQDEAPGTRDLGSPVEPDASRSAVIVGQPAGEHIDPTEGDILEVTAAQAAVVQADRLGRGQASTWLDLRRDGLAAPHHYEQYRRYVGAVIVMAALLLVCIAGVSQWRGRQYESLSSDYRAQQVELFKTVMPGQRVPGSIRARLASEHQKLRGIGGLAAQDGDAIGRTPSALHQLHRVLSSLPSDVRFRVLDLSISPELIRIDGQARNHADAERLTIALRQDGTYEVEPPKTQALRDQGVSFVFSATPRVSDGMNNGDRP